MTESDETSMRVTGPTLIALILGGIALTIILFIIFRQIIRAILQ